MSMIDNLMITRSISNMMVPPVSGTPTLRNVATQAKCAFYDTTYYRDEMYYVSYASGSEGVWQSKDYGNTWRKVFEKAGVAGSDYRQIWKNKRGQGFVWYRGGNLVRTTSDWVQAETFTDMYHPLSITNGIDEDPVKDIIMFAEYAGNNGTNGKRIWRSTTNGASWEVAHEDTTIGHWHTCQRDPYTGYWYATSGDSGSGIKIIQSKDDGVTWNVLAQNSQEFRLCGLGFTEEYILWATDHSAAEVGTLNLWKIKKTDLELDWNVAKQNISDTLEGPAYGMVKTAEGRFLFWTAAENREMSKLYLTDGKSVKEILSTSRNPNTPVLNAGFAGGTKVDNNNRILVSTDQCAFGNSVFLMTIPIGMGL